jgi:3-oxoacyl-[acyl-carrier-protein] synthase-1
VAPVAITATGLVTPLGFNAPSSLAALRAGVSAIGRVNLWDYESGERIGGGRVPLPQWEEGLPKLADLAAAAIAEVARAARPLSLEQIPVLIGVAGRDRPGRSERLEREIFSEVEARTGSRFHPASRLIAGDRLSGILGLLHARRLLDDRTIPACIVAGVDSFLDRSAAHELMKRRRILTPANSNGFAPGEAAAAVLVQRAEETAGAVLDVLGLGTGRDTGTIDSDAPLRGDGLTRAISGALAEAGATIFDAAYRITDLNGEHYKFKEAVFATMRLEHGQRRIEVFGLWHPNEFLGDIGAAIGPCAFGLALHAGLRAYAPGPIALCHFGSDDGERGAALVRFRTTGDQDE